MKISSNNLAKSELAFHFETNDAVQPYALGTFLREMQRIAGLRRHFGPEAEVRLIEIGTGSVWGKIAIAVGAAGGVAGMGSFLLDLEKRLNSPTDALAQAVATMSLDSSVVSATIVTQDRVITVRTADMPAVDALAERRAGELAKPTPQVGHFRRLGEPIVFDGGTAKHSTVSDPARVVNLPLHGRVPSLYPQPRGERVDRYLIGELHPANPGSAMTFITEKGLRYDVTLSPSLDLDDYPFGRRIILRGIAEEEGWQRRQITALDINEIAS